MSLSLATARRYLGLLEVGNQLHELPPYFANLSKRLLTAPRLSATDSGFTAHIANIRS